jgi:hypothetical protein
VAWLVLSSLLVVGARDELVSGRDRAGDVAELSLSEILDGGAIGRLQKAAADFRDGQSLLANPVLAPWKPVPVLGRQLRTVQDLSGAASSVADAAARFLVVVEEHEDARSGPDRLAAIAALSDEAVQLQAAVRAADLGPGEGLVWFVDDAYDELDPQLDELSTALVDTIAALDGLLALLTGPTDIILLAANNAEMRAGHGALLSWGLLHAEGGELGVPGGMQPIRTFPTPATAPPLSPELEEGWGWIDLTNVANLGVTPRWDATADRVLDLYEAATGVRPGGAMVLDSAALAKLIRITDQAIPAADGSRLVSPEDALGYLMHDQYENVAPDGFFDLNDERREGLAVIAESVMERILEDTPLPELVEALAELGRGRHLLAFSDDPVLQAGWEAIEVSGTLHPGDVSVALVNAGGNKLDQFIETEIDVTSAPDKAGGVTVTLSITAENTTPEAESPYIIGRVPEDGPLGGYASLLTISVPGGAIDPAIDETARYAVHLADGPSTTMAVRLDLAPGEEKTVTARFTVPASTVLHLLPTARLPRTTWSIDGQGRRDEGPIELDL